MLYRTTLLRHDPGSILYTFAHDVLPSSWWSFHCHCQCRFHHCYC